MVLTLLPLFPCVLATLLCLTVSFHKFQRGCHRKMEDTYKRNFLRHSKHFQVLGAGYISPKSIARQVWTLLKISQLGELRLSAPSLFLIWFICIRFWPSQIAENVSPGCQIFIYRHAIQVFHLAQVVGEVDNFICWINNWKNCIFIYTFCDSHINLNAGHSRFHGWETLGYT